MAERVEATAVAVRTEDWPAQATDTIVRVVGKVRDTTTGKAITAARAVVYGLLAAVLGVVAMVVIAIATVRFVDSYLPDSLFGETHTWAAHLILGLFFTGAGVLLWSRRAARLPE